MASALLLSLLLLSAFSLSSSLSSKTILDASEILTDSGFTSMALTIELASQSLIQQSSSLTIFAPPDSAFSRSGQPPLSLLRYHLLPNIFSAESLHALPLGAKIPTMLPGRFLTVTMPPMDDWISLNNVTVGRSPIYQDGSLVIFGIDKFFDPYFESSAEVKRTRMDLECVASNQNDQVGVLATALRNRGWSIMASFLDVQFLGLQKQRLFTIFAPVDNSLINHISDFTDWRSILHRHIVPCKLRWTDLAEVGDGTEIRTFLEGFNINVTRTGGVLLLNNVSVIFPDMYYSDWVVVHGIEGILEAQNEIKEAAESSSEAPVTTGLSPESEFDVSDINNAVAHYHFSVLRS